MTKEIIIRGTYDDEEPLTSEEYSELIDMLSQFGICGVNIKE